MKKILLALSATFAVCLAVFAGTNMCLKKQNGDILKFNVDDIYEVYYESFISGDTTIVPPFIDSVVVDASSLPLEFEILTNSTALVSGYDYRYFYDEATAMPLEREIEIPAKVRIDGKIYDVVRIREYAFNYCGNLTNVKIPSSVKGIGYDAFRYCASLNSIELPQDLYGIYGSTFANCQNLTNINIPENVRIIGDNAFANCQNLTKITVPSKVDSIGEGAFMECRNLDIVIDNSRDSIFIGNAAFYNCKSVTFTKKSSVSIDPATDLTRMPLSFTILSDSTAEVKGTVWDHDSILHYHTLESLVIPERVQIDGKRYVITSIGNYAFHWCHVMRSVEIPTSVNSIGNNAFDGCYSLTSIEIPSSVNSIGDHAFNYCTNAEIVIDNSRDNIKFYKNNYDYYTGNNNNNVQEATIEESGAFYDVKSVTFTKDNHDPSAVDASKTPLSFKILTDSTVEVIGGEWWIDSLNIPEKVRFDGKVRSVTEIGRMVFAGYSLTHISIPESIISIADSAFTNCSNLTSIEIPSSVTYIGDYAFYGCSSLTSIEIPSSVTSIGEWAFYSCSSFTSITIPSSVTSIGYSAFAKCDNLTAIEIPSSVTSIGEYAFYGCRSLTSIEIPSSVTSIGYGTFWGCRSLTSIEIPSSVTEIGNDAFLFCENLDVVIDNSEENVKVENSAFEGVKSVKWLK